MQLWNADKLRRPGQEGNRTYKQGKSIKVWGNSRRAKAQL